MRAVARGRSCDFRTFQVYPKSAARKHSQALALSNGHIPPYWRQKAFSGSVKSATPPSEPPPPPRSFPPPRAPFSPPPPPPPAGNGICISATIVGCVGYTR